MRSAEIHARYVVGVVWLSLCAFPVGAEIASFTDSQGRTALYQYSLKPEWDPAVPRGVLIYFHGNNTGTQRALLRWFFPSVQGHAYRQDLVPVAVASPEARGSGADSELQFYRAAPHTGHGARVWLDEDQSLIQELLQDEFGGAFRVDFDRVVFWGASQGTCFLNRFVQRYGDDYGGGLLADCGCSEGPDPLWRPPERFKDSFRVFVRAATGDFLHTLSLQAYGYYRYIVGLETRGDFERTGGHCWPGDVSNEAAIEWLVHGTGLPEEPEEPRFERVALMDGIVAVTVDSDGTLWVARQPSRRHPASLWRSVDRGNTLEPVSRTSLVVEDLDAVDGVLILTANSKEYSWLPEVSFHRSTDAGATFSELDLEGGEVSSAGTTTDRHQRVYVLIESPQERGHPEILRSDDLGRSFRSLGSAGERYSELMVDPLATEDQEGYLFLKRWARAVEWIGSTSGNDWSRVGDTPAGPPDLVTWDGTTLWGVADRYPRLYASVDHGGTWEKRSMPKAATITFGVYYGPGITALGDGELLLIGGGYDGFLFDAGSREWRHVLGGAAIGYHGATIKDGVFPGRRIAVDHLRGDVFVTDGRGVFRLGGDVRGGDPSVPDGDADRDGIPDGLDAFPNDPGEYLDTDGDGVGNARDGDDDGDGVPDHEDGVALDASESLDTDADGVGDRQDQDDDGDGVWDVTDAFPLDGREQVDSDGDGVGDWADEDDDGDGVTDVEDAFPLYPHEWSDADRDGVGDNIDRDDDNDGIPDAEDPLVSELASRATLEPADPSVLEQRGFPWLDRPVHVRALRWVGSTYPEPLGVQQEYGHLTLGDGPDPQIHFMVDRLGGRTLVYLDRNDNGDLTDDGPPEEFVYSNDWSYVEVAYSSGLVLPYSVQYGGFGGGHGALDFGGAWIGDVEVGGSPVAVLTVDYDIDGLFDGPEDYVCVDTDRDRRLGCRQGDTSELFRTGDTIQLDGQTVRVSVATSGHQVELRPVTHFVSTFPSASHATQQGFVRVINHGDQGGVIEIEPVDDEGATYGPVTLTIAAGETVHFNSDDLEQGNTDKGLSDGVGAGVGTWRLELRTDLDVEVLSYIRTADGFVTSMHDIVVDRAGVYRVPFFNPGSNLAQVSLLRLVNPGGAAASVSIVGVDDSGWRSTPVEVAIPARTARTLSASDLEDGVGVEGALGDGRGKWQLHVTSSRYIRVMSLMESPTGHLTNLSADAWNRGAGQFVSAFPPSAHPTQQGFVRVINHSHRGGLVEVEPVDEEGTRYGPLALNIGARETLHFNSDDLELGNPEKGLASGVGVGVGMWRLELRSDLDIETLSYIRHADGFLTSAHDLVPGYGGVYRVPFLNPGSNQSQVSRLRLVNPRGSSTTVSVRGVDDTGWSSPALEVTIPPLASRTLSASDLESGMGLQGALGDGSGKWQLRVASARDVRVMSLLESPTGHLTNLSTTLRLPATARGVVQAPYVGRESSPLGPITREAFVDLGAGL